MSTKNQKWHWPAWEQGYNAPLAALLSPTTLQTLVYSPNKGAKNVDLCDHNNLKPGVYDTSTVSTDRKWHGPANKAMELWPEGLYLIQLAVIIMDALMVKYVCSL